MTARNTRTLALAAAACAAGCFYNPKGSEPQAETTGESTSDGSTSEVGSSADESTTSSGSSTGSSGCEGECTTAPTTTDPTTTDPTGASSTGETPCTTDCPASTCGNGRIDAPEGEECDDGNDVENDGCNSWCRLPRRVFVSSEETIVGAFGGSSAADDQCTSMANSAGLLGTFKAWVSDTASTPATRFDVSFKGAYLLPDDTAVAVAGWGDLTDGTLAAPIKVTELGATIADGYAWTGTTTTGAATGEDCSDWTDTMNGTTGIAGKISAVDAKWTEYGPLACPAQWRLYCFEDPGP